MAQKQRDGRLKQALLLALVAVNVVLVLLIWADGLRAGDGELPGYYRSVPGSAEDAAPARVTPFPDGSGRAGQAHEEGGPQGGGQGAGRVRATATPLPKSTAPLPILPSLDGDDA